MPIPGSNVRICQRSVLLYLKHLQEDTLCIYQQQKQKQQQQKKKQKKQKKKQKQNKTKKTLLISK